MIRALTIIFCSLFLLLPAWVSAATVPRIAVLLSHDTPVTQQVQAGFQDYFADQGRQMELVVHSLADAETPAAVFSDLRNGDVALLFALGTKALEAATQLTEIPVVGSLSLHDGLFAKHRHMTGVSLRFPLEVQIAWLQKVLPQAKNVGVIYSSEENRVLMQQADRLLGQRGFSLHQVQIDEPAELSWALKSLENRADVLLGLTDVMVLNKATAKNVLLFSLRNKIPFVGLSEAWVKAGAIYALQRNYLDLGRQCGEIALKILAGEQPGAIKVASPRMVRYSLSRKVAERLKIEFKAELIENAESVF